jgi:hypothetical protein
MRKAIVIGISLLFFIGIASQGSARKIHCWDLNENYECDIDTEDMNNDGKCNSRDCETEEQCYAVPQTGQTICYDTDGGIIECAGTGQDGEYQYGTPWPEPRFTDNLDGTVTDHLTGLIWLKSANCFGGLRTQANALSDCNGLADGQCGLTDGSVAGDWRLPNVRELQSLIHYGVYWPALSDTAGTGQWSEGDPFTGVQSFYWSATTYAYDSYYAWGVYMDHGHVSTYGKSSNYNVWPVRGGN